MINPSRIESLPFNIVLPLLARMDGGTAGWKQVGCLRRGAGGLSVTFSVEGAVCQPAWGALVRGSARDGVAKISFGAAVGRLVLELGSVAVTASVIADARVAGAGERVRARDVGCGGPAPVRSCWPDFSREDGPQRRKAVARSV